MASGYVLGLLILSTVQGVSTSDGKTVPCGAPLVQATSLTALAAVVGKRIVGGVQAIPGSWPWMVMLKKKGEMKCGGSIIDRHVVLTAAHCFYGETDLSEWKVFVGKHYIDTTDESEEIYTIKKVILHESFENSTLKSDIALLLLQDPILYNGYVRPICIPPTQRRVVPKDSMCYTTGWGETRGTGDRNVLNQVDVPIKDGFFCRRRYNQTYINGLTFCAGYEAGRKDACMRDSGGPLNCRKNGKWYVQGITSWGFDCAQPQWPGIYTDVSKYGTWIRKNMLQAGFPLTD